MAAATLPTNAGAAQPRELVKPTWQSLAEHRRIPDWFRDAKFGIWAHWGPQCVPEFGDWYGRLMYIQGSPFYDHHVKTYGHPSRNGFIDIIGRWRAEAWDPERLMRLYKAAGAKYFVALANHHDNFDTFASRHHGWNAARVGPKRDLIAGWAAAARSAGLKFGVSNHSAHAWHWQQAAYGYDPEGTLQGVRYDAWRLRKADGAGRWWQGLDPQDLYTGPNMPPPDGITSIAAMDRWRDGHDGQWLETPPPANPDFVSNWLLRCNDLADQHRPDLVYFDDTGLPLGEAGLRAAAHIYDADLARGGSGVVVTGKKLDAIQRRAIVEDVERGFSDSLRDEPWQTDTCIGDWHYNRRRYLDHSYVPAKAVVQRLIDVVSKNGSLLLSIPVRGDGSIDADEEAILADLAAWMRINGEAIFATRPWKTFGEGPTRVAAGSMNEAEAAPFTAQDKRFTTRDGVLYVLLMEWPSDGRVRIESLGDRSGLAGLQRIELLGHGPVSFRRGPDGVVIDLPAARPTAFCPGFKLYAEAI